MSPNTLQDVIRENAKIESRGLVFVKNQKEEIFISYKELFTRAKLYLGEIQRFVSGRECKEIVFQIDDQEDFLISFCACILGNLIPVPLSTGNQDDCQIKLISVWKTLEAPFLLTDEKNHQRLQDFCRKTENDFHDEIKNQFITDQSVNSSTTIGEEIEAQNNDIAFLQFSSGTTGSPKGSIVRHKNLLVNCTAITDRAAIDESDKSISWLPFTHDFGLICVFIANFIQGIDQVFLPGSLFIRRPALWLEKASTHRCSVLYTPNFGLQYVNTSIGDKDFDWDLSCIRVIFNGAEPVIHEVCESFVARLEPFGLRKNAIYPVYGMAEATVGISVPRVDHPYGIPLNVNRDSLQIGQKISIQPNDLGALKLMPLGPILSGCQVRICDDNGLILDEKVTGNIQLHGENIISGYYNNEEETNNLFTPDGWIHTGDIGFLYEGELVVSGRKKNTMIINGQNFYPHDIESCLSELQEIEFGSVLACGITIEEGKGESLVLFIVRKNLTCSIELENSIREVVFKTFGLSVHDIVPIRKVPKTTSGKPQYFKLREAYLNQKSEANIA